MLANITCQNSGNKIFGQFINANLQKIQQPTSWKYECQIEIIIVRNVGNDNFRKYWQL